MYVGLRFWPEQASTLAAEVDLLSFFILAVCVVFSLLIWGLVIVLAIAYRRRSPLDQATAIPGRTWLQLLWSAIPFALVLLIFLWGAELFFRSRQAPADALRVYAVAKQWMWKFQHVQGQREINELHVPVGRPVELIMTSEDVIHSWFVPAFRAKMDVVPGRYTSVWFEATRAGSYRLFCAEYCGTAHSGMTGRVVVLPAVQYERWLREAGTDREPLALTGERLFHRLRCHSCHGPRDTTTGPALAGVYGRQVLLRNGSSVTADDGYLRESLLHPASKLVAGYKPLMPTYAGQITEEGVVQLIDYLKSLRRTAKDES